MCQTIALTGMCLGLAGAEGRVLAEKLARPRCEDQIFCVYFVVFPRVIHGELLLTVPSSQAFEEVGAAGWRKPYKVV